jgi:hypothetical protein
LLGAWLLASAATYLVALMMIFPEAGSAESASWIFSCPPLGALCQNAPTLGVERGFLLLTILGGALGATLHALQSFAAFVGNRSLRMSWAWWYLMRAPIGATLGALFYVVARGGLMPGVTDGVSPYGVLAIGGLAGLFSMKATEKLSDIFDAMFSTKEENADKLQATTIAIDSVLPAQIPVGGGAIELRVQGSGFSEKSVIELDGVELDTEFGSEAELSAEIDPQGRAGGSEGAIVVVEAVPPKRRSAAVPISFT